MTEEPEKAAHFQDIRGESSRSSPVIVKNFYNAAGSQHTLLKRGRNWQTLEAAPLEDTNCVKTAKKRDVKHLMAAVGQEGNEFIKHFYGPISDILQMQWIQTVMTKTRPPSASTKMRFMLKGLKNYELKNVLSIIFAICIFFLQRYINWVGDIELYPETEVYE